MYVLHTEPQSAGGILDAAYKLFRASFSSQLALAVVVAALMTLPLVGIAWAAATVTDPFAIIDLIFSVRVLGACLVLAIACATLYAAMMLRMEAFAQGETITTVEAVTAAMRDQPRIAIASILFIVAKMVGCCLLLVPGLVLAQSLMFYLPAIALDDKGAIESLGYSHRLVWGSWWRTAGIWGFGLLLSTVVVYLATAVGLVLTVLPLDLGVLEALEIVTQGLATIVVTPFLVALWLELYRDLKLRRRSDAASANAADIRQHG
jgi:hypothetical protein